MKRTSIFAALALAVAAMGASYHLTITSPTWAGGNQLMPGEYTITEMANDKIMLKSGKNSIEIPAKIETEATKYSSTSLHTLNEGGKNTLEEIWVGGTKTKIILNK